MRFVYGGALWLGCLIVAPLVCAAPVTYTLEAQESALTFEGRSTLHDFTGTTHALSGRMAFDPERQTLEGQAEIRLPVASFDTGIAARDKALRVMFEAEQHPEIRITFTSLTRLAPGRYRLAGQVTIRTITQPLECEVQATVTPAGIAATGEARLTTTQFDLHPPSVMGVIRVRPAIVVRFASRWKPG